VVDNSEKPHHIVITENNVIGMLFAMLVNDDYQPIIIGIPNDEI
jgi:hypothetical protein